MKYVENMLTGFDSESGARAVAAGLSTLPNTFAEYHDADNETPGEWTEWCGEGHCVRLVLSVVVGT